MSTRLPGTVVPEDVPPAAGDAGLTAPGLRAEQRFVDSVAQLTLHRDIDALDHSLTLSLAELLHARQVLLYKRLGDDGRSESLVICRHTASGHYEVRPSSAAECAQWHDRLQACVEDPRPGRMAAEDGRFALWTPIRRDGSAIGVLMADGVVAFDTMSSVIDGFCRIYANYVSLIREAERDKLTGLFNRSTLDRHMQRLLERTQGVAGDPPADRLWLAILDIDHFKRVNDTYGHLYGDEVILWVAQQLRSSFASPNALFRFGGEEFVALLLAPDEAGVQALLEDFRAGMASHVFSQIGTVTASIGYVEVAGGGFSTVPLDRADKALYFAKNHGRNQVRSYRQLLEAGLLEGEVPVGGSVDLF